MNIKISSKIAVILFSLIVIPNLIIIVLHDIKSNHFDHLMILYTTLIIILVLPISKLIAYCTIDKDLKKINNSLNNARKGEYNGHFHLPLQKINEAEMIKLKRNINWLMHAFSSRENTLNSKLAKEKDSKRKFRKKSYIDSLTKINNRRYFDENISSIIDNSVIDETNISLVMIDCDNFKEINDSFGHQAGDDVLRTLGKILRDTTRDSEDHPFRYGGDEFGIILLNTPTERVTDIAEKVNQKFNNDNPYNTTLSIGIANCHNSLAGSINPEKLKKLADEALYQSKHTGKNNINIKYWNNYLF